MILPELARLIHQIELRKNKKTQTLRAGSVVTSKSGRGLDFKEVREYLFGDDIRYIDWNVSSRMGDLYVKEYHKENDRIVFLFLDESASMFTLSASEYTKYFIGFQFIAFASLIFLLSGDRVHVATYSDKLNFLSQTIKTKGNAYKILKRLYEKRESNQKTDHTIPLRFLKNRVMRNSLAYIISDFYGVKDLQSYFPLTQIYDLNGVQIYDTIEIMDSKIFDYFFAKNPETNKGGKFQNEYELNLETAKSFFQTKLLRLRADEDIAFPIMRFLLQ